MSNPSPEPADPDVIAILRDLADSLSREAGELIRSGRPTHVAVADTKSSAVDVVTAMDRASEDLLRARIAEHRPDDAVLGEEYGTRAGTSAITWVIDPVDGTVNYLYGVGSYAVSVAAVIGPPDPQRWTVVAGAVHSVVDARTWTAGLGHGATLDGVALPGVQARALDQCLVGTGFGYVAERRIDQARVLGQIIGKVRDIRRMGAAAIDLCLVASGELDLYYERGLQPWDMAAGSLIATEAGALVTGLPGQRADSEMTIAGPPQQVQELALLLAEADADRV